MDEIFTVLESEQNMKMMMVMMMISTREGRTREISRTLKNCSSSSIVIVVVAVVVL
jgi:hypothetical protein